MKDQKFEFWKVRRYKDVLVHLVCFKPIELLLTAVTKQQNSLPLFYLSNYGRNLLPRALWTQIGRSSHKPWLSWDYYYVYLWWRLQERQQLEEKKRREEMELDYLAPFLAQIGDPEKLTRQEAMKLKEDCLSDLKQRLIDKANLIQSRFEKVNTHHRWNQGSHVKAHNKGVPWSISMVCHMLSGYLVLYWTSV